MNQANNQGCLQWQSNIDLFAFSTGLLAPVVRTSPVFHTLKKFRGALLARGMLAGQRHLGITNARIPTATDVGGTRDKSLTVLHPISTPRWQLQHKHNCEQGTRGTEDKDDRWSTAI